MIRIFKRPVALSILSGLLIGTSYIPFPPWAIFFCFVPLWISWLEEPSWKRIFWTGWLTAFLLTLIGFNWVAYTVYEFGHLPIPFALGTLILFCACANLSVPLAGLIWFYFCRTFRVKTGGRICALPLFFAIGERTFPMIFDWHFGYTWLWARFPAFHLADIVGFIGLSNIGLAFNACFLWAWWKYRQGRRWWPPAAAVPALFLVLNVWGYVHGSHLDQPDASLKFLIVQANVGDQEKLAAETGGAYRDVVINRFAAMTLKALEQAPADFAVWPETAFPEIIESPRLDFGYAQKLKEMIIHSHTKLITGGYSRLVRTKQITNSFFVLSDKGEYMAPPYHKTALLAFGEYVPFGEYFPWVHEKIPEIGDFGRGPGPSVLDTGELKIGAQICYEGLFDWFTRQLAQKGAQILVNVTNDSWFGKWEEPFQHGWMTLARAVEVRRPLVRSTNTGISTVVLADGKILDLSPLHEEWFHLYEVPYVKNPEPTLFMGWAYWLIPALIAFGLVGIAIRGRFD